MAVPPALLNAANRKYIRFTYKVRGEHPSGPTWRLVCEFTERRSIGTLACPYWVLCGVPGSHNATMVIWASMGDHAWGSLR